MPTAMKDEDPIFLIARDKMSARICNRIRSIHIHKQESASEVSQSQADLL
jgi:hypothetical protein